MLGGRSSPHELRAHRPAMDPSARRNRRARQRPTHLSGDRGPFSWPRRPRAPLTRSSAACAPATAYSHVQNSATERRDLVPSGAHRWHHWDVALMAGWAPKVGVGADVPGRLGVTYRAPNAPRAGSERLGLSIAASRAGLLGLGRRLARCFGWRYARPRSSVTVVEEYRAPSRGGKLSGFGALTNRVRCRKARHREVVRRVGRFRERDAGS